MPVLAVNDQHPVANQPALLHLLPRLVDACVLQIHPSGIQRVQCFGQPSSLLFIPAPEKVQRKPGGAESARTVDPGAQKVADRRRVHRLVRRTGHLPEGAKPGSRRLVHHPHPPPGEEPVFRNHRGDVRHGSRAQPDPGESSGKAPVPPGASGRWTRPGPP